MTSEARDRPRLSENQTLVSPVVLAGPPRLTLAKPAVLTFGHCADLRLGGWELGVYHCDSLFPGGSSGAPAEETPWVKLATIGQEVPEGQGPPPPILASMDAGGTSCIMSEVLSRFCVVGQSGAEGNAVKVRMKCIYVIDINKHVLA